MAIKLRPIDNILFSMFDSFPEGHVSHSIVMIEIIQNPDSWGQILRGMSVGEEPYKAAKEFMYHIMADELVYDEIDELVFQILFDLEFAWRETWQRPEPVLWKGQRHV